jgi:RsiW-degrading membrane proteinase PrsW (M82 family)
MSTPSFSGGIINTFFALVFAVIIVTIVWAMVMYFTEMGSEHGKAEGKALILSSVTTLFIVMCIYALIDWARTSVGL